MTSRTQKLKKLNALELDLRRRELPGMVGRSEVEAELHLVEKELRELVTAYEQYFIGADRFEPSKERQILTLRLRRMVNLYIPQTDLRFRLQGLASRLQSFSAYWDRILRLIEEGRYVRQRSHLQLHERFRPREPGGEPPSPVVAEPLERVYRELVEAYENCRIRPPGREQLEEFLRRQADTIRARFGDRPVDLVVVVVGGKPKLRVRAKG
jgi:hypothetical protein